MPVNHRITRNETADIDSPSATADAEKLSCADEAYHQILARIIRGELPSGSPLKSTHLAATLGLSRTPIVQALARLAADGIVMQRHQQRAVVCTNAENWLLEIHELRLLLEPHAAARAAHFISGEVLQSLEIEASAVCPEADLDWLKRAREFDFSLHLAIAHATGNRPLRDTINKCWQFKRLSYQLSCDRAEHILSGYREHLSILAALKARDPARASAAMEIHLRHASSYRPEQRVV
ncbi:MAG: GntR family transcriptional regulator [Pirellulales bacterium]|nr:GntR family transcriptional regulator [Pirellulales bacterium]